MTVRELQGSGLDEIPLRTEAEARAKMQRTVTCKCCGHAVEGKGVHVKYAIGADIFCDTQCRDGHEAGTCRCSWN